MTHNQENPVSFEEATSATYRAGDGSTKLKTEVGDALDKWGWQNTGWRKRTDAEVNSFIAGWEAAKRHTGEKNA